MLEKVIQLSNQGLGYSEIAKLLGMEVSEIENILKLDKIEKEEKMLDELKKEDDSIKERQSLFLAKNFEEASTALWTKLIKDGYSGVMQYKPFSDQYWNEKCKIVICNYENLGYENIQNTDLTHEHFKGWITYKKSKTVHYTAVFANTLKSVMELGDFSIKEMKSSCNDVDKIWNSMKNMVYMNIRPTSGANAGKANKGETHKIIKKYRDELRDYIVSLQADIFVISSKDSVGIFNYLFDLSDTKIISPDGKTKVNNLRYKGKTRVDDMLVYSVPHFGRYFSYDYYYKKAYEIVYDVYHK